MADPLTITTAVIGVLSSLTTLSIRTNEFRKDFTEASIEITSVNREVNDLALILQRLLDTRGSLSLPADLSRDFARVLKDLNRAVSEIDAFLTKTSNRKLRSAYWAFSGKRECIGLCRGLESYKATLNLTLILSSVITSHDIEEKANIILSEIRNVRANLAVTRDNFILERYLRDTETYAESVQEKSTVVGGAVSVSEEFDLDGSAIAGYGRQSNIEFDSKTHHTTSGQASHRKGPQIEPSVQIPCTSSITTTGPTSLSSSPKPLLDLWGGTTHYPAHQINLPPEVKKVLKLTTSVEGTQLAGSFEPNLPPDPYNESACLFYAADTNSQRPVRIANIPIPQPLQTPAYPLAPHNVSGEIADIAIRASGEVVVVVWWRYQTVNLQVMSCNFKLSLRKTPQIELMSPIMVSNGYASPKISKNGTLFAFSPNDSMISVLDIDGEGNPEKNRLERHRVFQILGFSKDGEILMVNDTYQIEIILLSSFYGTTVYRVDFNWLAELFLHNVSYHASQWATKLSSDCRRLVISNLPNGDYSENPKPYHAVAFEVPLIGGEIGSSNIVNESTSYTFTTITHGEWAMDISSDCSLLLCKSKLASGTINILDSKSGAYVSTITSGDRQPWDIWPFRKASNCVEHVCFSEHNDRIFVVYNWNKTIGVFQCSEEAGDCN